VEGSGLLVVGSGIANPDKAREWKPKGFCPVTSRTDPCPKGNRRPLERVAKAGQVADNADEQAWVILRGGAKPQEAL